MKIYCIPQAIYYIPPDTTHRNAQGKLPNKVKNIKYNLQKKDAGTVHLSPSSVQCVLEPLGRTKIINPAKLEGFLLIHNISGIKLNHYYNTIKYFLIYLRNDFIVFSES